jgi:hypothetical protein
MWMPFAASSFALAADALMPVSANADAATAAAMRTLRVIFTVTSLS